MAETLTRSPRATTAPPQELRLVTFTLGPAEYAVDVADVYGIYHGLPLIPRPDYASHVDGEVQLSEGRIRVVSLRRFAGLEEAPPAPRWIVLFNTPGGPVGLLVDKVTEVVRLAPSALSRRISAAGVPLADHIRAAATYHGRCLYLPDLGRLLANAIA